jgi:hypothetical protein
MSVTSSSHFLQPADRAAFATSTLQRAIIQADAGVYPCAEVMRFMQWTERRLAREFRMRNLGVTKPLAASAGILAGTVFSTLWSHDPHSPLASLYATLACLSFLLAAVSGHALLAGLANRSSLPSWRSTRFANFISVRTVPTEIRQLARGIRRHCKDTVMTVEHLEYNAILKVQHEGETYYVAVWDQRLTRSENVEQSVLPNRNLAELSLN